MPSSPSMEPILSQRQQRQAADSWSDTTVGLRIPPDVAAQAPALLQRADSCNSHTGFALADGRVVHRTPDLARGEEALAQQTIDGGKLAVDVQLNVFELSCSKHLF